jgi:putative Ca2+/H+ antiporter (TMEM165/GDT1 family)
MLELVTAALSAFGVVFVAELGDKTQFVALGFGARHGMRAVLLGLLLGYAAAGAVAATVGGVLGATLPARPIALAGGALFVLFAVLAVAGSDDDADGDAGRIVRTHHVVASIALSIALAEMGDKTQLATAALAARSNPLVIWIGATGGEVAAGMIGALAGRRIGARFDARIIRYASGALFGVFGVALLVTAW